MWLLSSCRAELKFFVAPEHVPGGYAILSHVWDDYEETFQDIQCLRGACAENGDNPRDKASPKIRQSCLLAEKHGWDWIWIDTCCIDKSSSSELSEAINSVYRWYAGANVCYAYLVDVSAGKDPRAEDSEFRRSRWFITMLLECIFQPVRERRADRDIPFS